MKARATLLAVAVVTATFAGVSHAAAPKVCKLVSDPAGDSHIAGTAGPADSSLDLVGGDLATDASTLTSVIRVAKFSKTNPKAPLGQYYATVFSAKGADNSLFTAAGIYPTGTQFIYGYYGPDPTNNLNTFYKMGDAKGVIDAAKSEIRVSVPLAAFKEQAKIVKGTKLSGITLSANAVYGQRLVPSQSIGPSPRIPIGGLSLQEDTGTSTKAYVAGTPSCVAVGK
jgi:hypothetical protein